MKSGPKNCLFNTHQCTCMKYDMKRSWFKYECEIVVKGVENEMTNIIRYIVFNMQMWMRKQKKQHLIKITTTTTATATITAAIS